ncbi:MAG: peptidoglycan DD-metalloendopeptidase family protein [Elusimicrobiota bacterium]|nr:peptidoglycan DD-metalloendopeptidase family protein [Elusimicrobiota bacterium]
MYNVKFNFRFICVLLCIFLLFHGVIISSIKDTKQKLEETKKSIQQKKKQKEMFILQQRSVQNELKDIERQLKQLDKEIKKIKSDINLTKSEINALEKNLSILTSDAEFYEKLLGLILKQYVENYVLNISFYKRNFVRRIKKEVMKQLSVELVELQKNIITTAKLKQERETKEKKLQSYYTELMKKEKEQKNLFLRKSQLLKEYKVKQENLEQEITKLIQTQQELEKILKRLQRDSLRKKEVAKNVILDRKFIKPINGEIVEKFGKKQISKDGSCVIRNGIIIQGMSDSNVISADDGKILFVSENFRSYGKIIILESKDNVHIIYGQLGDILVNEGAKVSKGQIIGKTNSSGQIYFELRKNFIPVDPELYFE